MENEQDETTVKKNFLSLPAQLRELVLSKTDTATRLKLFQINNEMREWVHKEELFGDILDPIRISSYAKAYIRTRNFSLLQIDLSKQYVFKVVRRCKELAFGDGDFTLTRTFPRLQTIDRLAFDGTDFTRLSQMFMGTAIQVTGSCCFISRPYVMTNNIVEILSQFIQSHLKRCATVYMRMFPFEKFFDLLGTQRFLQASFDYRELEGDRWERDLKMIIQNGVPGLHPDSMIEMRITFQSNRSSTAVRVLFDAMILIFNMISASSSVVMENEAIRQKFHAANKNVGLCWTGRSLFGLKRRFDEDRNLIFLVCTSKGGVEIIIDIKFDPIEK